MTVSFIALRGPRSLEHHYSLCRRALYHIGVFDRFSDPLCGRRGYEFEMVGRSMCWCVSYAVVGLLWVLFVSLDMQ